MRLSFIALIIALLCAAPAQAQGHVSAATRMAMHRSAAASKAPTVAGQTVRAFITVDSPQAVKQLRAMGVHVQARFDGIITASVPLSVVPQVGRVAGVRQLSVAQPLTLCNDSALTDARVVPIAQAEGFAGHFDGKGVVVGIIDSGVDFNHINLCDPNGVSRVAAAYLPHDSTGVAPVIGGDTLPGSHYDTPEQIAALTTDTPTASHGTHTTGTAAGSCLNGFQGVAPAATLVICAMPELYDSDIANSLRYIYDYADRMGMPAVVNMSFASSDGPHDGTSPLSRLFDQLSGPGRILSVSAHNTGYAGLHLEHDFTTEADTLSTMLNIYSTYNANVSLWSSPGHRHRVALTLVDKTDKRIVLETPYLDDLAPDSVLTLDMGSDAVWSEYVTGTAQFATAVEDDDRTHSIMVSTIKPIDTSRHRLGLKVVGDDDPRFNAWVWGGTFFGAAVDGQKGGTKAGTINDLVTGEKPISVGAYVTKQEYPIVAGGTYTVARAKPMHGIAYFSAWGPDANGRPRPDICAPGMTLVSSSSRYDTGSSLVNQYNLSFFHSAPSGDYPYSACYGTSMSAPVMTGTIALMLQAKPDLSSDEIRDILDHTAVRDEHVIAGDERQWGRGKLNAAAAMHRLLRMVTPHDVNGDGAVDITDVNQVINVMLGKTTDPDILAASDVDGNGAVDITDVNTVINVLLGKPVTLSH